MLWALCLLDPVPPPCQGPGTKGFLLVCSAMVLVPMALVCACKAILAKASLSAKLGVFLVNMSFPVYAFAWWMARGLH